MTPSVKKTDKRAMDNTGLNSVQWVQILFQTEKDFIFSVPRTFETELPFLFVLAYLPSNALLVSGCIFGCYVEICKNHAHQERCYPVVRPAVDVVFIVLLVFASLISAKQRITQL